MTYRYYSPAPRSSGARTASVVFGITAAALIGALVWLRTGSTTWGVVTAGAIFVVALYSAIGAARGVSLFLATGLFLLTAGGTWYGVAQALAIYRAVSTYDGPVDAADPDAYASAEAAIALAEDETGFRIELTEQELGAYVQDGLREAENNPIRRVEVDVEDGVAGAPGTLAISGRFKSGEIDFYGKIAVLLEAGAIRVDVVRLEVGDLDLPGVGRDAVEDILAEIADLNEALAGLDADVQSILLADDRILVTGTHATGAVLTSDTLLRTLRDQAEAIGSGVEPPDQRIGPGWVNSLSSPGSPVVLALGDSLAANAGVDKPRLGYVSRVHAALERRDDADYGLRNLARTGETTGTMIRTGQLDDAVTFLADADAAYVIIDIGANDLLGHLGSTDCDADIDAPACTRRLEAAFATYEANLEVILERLAGAAPEATIVYLTAYNPFSLGLAGGVGFERRTDEILAAFNAIGAEVAGRHGVVVADGFTPMQGTTGATTHMLDVVPDIHPTGIGHDVLAAAVMDALG